MPRQARPGPQGAAESSEVVKVILGHHGGSFPERAGSVEPSQRKAPGLGGGAPLRLHPGRQRRRALADRRGHGLFGDACRADRCRRRSEVLSEAPARLACDRPRRDGRRRLGRLSLARAMGVRALRPRRPVAHRGADSLRPRFPGSATMVRPGTPRGPTLGVRGAGADRRRGGLLQSPRNDVPQEHRRGARPRRGTDPARLQAARPRDRADHERRAHGHDRDLGRATQVSGRSRRCGSSWAWWGRFISG